MKKLVLIILVGLCMANFSYSDSLTTLHTNQSLTKEQEASLAAQAAKMASDNVSEVAQPDRAAATVKSWVDIGSAIGSGLAASAKELGMAANQFATTPVGKVTMFLIVWHFFGTEAVHILFGVVWLLTGTLAWLYFYRRLAIQITTTVYEAGKGPGGITKQTVRKSNDFKDDGSQMLLTIYIILLLGMLLTGIIGIFSY